MSGSCCWQQVARCYQSLAHRHRMVFIERSPDAPVTEQDWADYRATYDPALRGTLFTDEYGYTGPGTGMPVTLWRTPWPQTLNLVVDAPESDPVRRACVAQVHQDMQRVQRIIDRGTAGTLPSAATASTCPAVICAAGV